MAGFAGGKIREGARKTVRCGETGTRGMVRLVTSAATLLQGLHGFQELAAGMRIEAAADFAGEHQLAIFVVADGDGAEGVALGFVAADDEFLLALELDLKPCAAAVRRFVPGIAAL